MSSSRRPILTKCKVCGKLYNLKPSWLGTWRDGICSVFCGHRKQLKEEGKLPSGVRKPPITTPGVDPKHYGALAEIIACEWLIRQGYDVFRTISQHGLADYVAWKVGEQPLLIDVKTAPRGSDGRCVFPAASRAQVAAGVTLLYVERELRLVSFSRSDFNPPRKRRDYQARYRLGVERQASLASQSPDLPSLPLSPP